MRLFLASASPRRRELMALCGLPFTVEVSKAEETAQGAPDAIVTQNALLKARAVFARHPEDAVLSADTVVYLPEAGRVLGKPKDEADAIRMLRLLSGRENLVFTGVALVGPGFEDARAEVSHVFLDDMTDAEIRAYAATGEPMDKAGAYAVQGKASLFIRSVTGSPSNVIGLPMHLVRRMLSNHGLFVFSSTI
ncbi:MAG: septum formation protein Maf [Clostridia bacterium]|nr:septum formation protein Maf [Clostridia bacterium]